MYFNTLKAFKYCLYAFDYCTWAKFSLQLIAAVRKVFKHFPGQRMVNCFYYDAKRQCSISLFKKCVPFFEDVLPLMFTSVLERVHCAVMLRLCNYVL